MYEYLVQARGCVKDLPRRIVAMAGDDNRCMLVQNVSSLAVLRLLREQHQWFGFTRGAFVAPPPQKNQCRTKQHSKSNNILHTAH